MNRSHTRDITTDVFGTEYARAVRQCHEIIYGNGVPRMNDTEILHRLDRIEYLLKIDRQRLEKDYYSTSELAQHLRRAEFTVREWCRNKRVNAKKRDCGRGTSREWMISKEEVKRIENEGLLPL